MIAERLKEAMQKKGYNQKILSQKTGITESAICRYLQGTRTAREEALIILSKELEVSIDWLLGVKK